MIKNKKFALAFRLCAMLFGIIGVMAQVGIFRGRVSFTAFMFYTIQSNLLAIGFFGFLAIRTARSMKEGLKGSASWHMRLGMVLSVNLLVTFVVFWALLVPVVPSWYVWTFENFAVHAITPLLCLLDYILFSEPRKLKYRDVYYTCIYPTFYVAHTSIAGLLGFVYGYEGIISSPFSSYIEIVPVRFPYFFMDFDKLGAMAIVYTIGILAFIILLAHVMYLTDRKLRKAK
jgi:hypothetical protein